MRAEMPDPGGGGLVEGIEKLALLFAGGCVADFEDGCGGVGEGGGEETAGGGRGWWGFSG